ncbi:MAG: PhoH family protein [Bacteroidales bacterium]|nr:PhoH family protein [Bacteroidales bacterium]
MMEKIVYLEGIDPQTFYGSGNRNFEKIKSYFPKLKIIGRNDEIKIIGESSEIIRFGNLLERISAYMRVTQNLPVDEMDRLILDTDTGADFPDQNGSELIIYGNSGKAIKARSANQKKLVDEYTLNDLIFAIGPAGTGKTYTAIALAVRALRDKEVKRIILTRPAVEAGEKLGFLPGDMKQKLDPYLQPLYDALRDMIPHKKLEGYIEEGVIEIAPLAFMRGRTLGDAFVILDEGQNTTMKQLKMFLTRMGKNAKFIVTGDITQIDLPEHVQSGLIIALDFLKDIHGISIIEFDTGDIVRHRLVKHIVDAFQKTASAGKLIKK